MANYHKERDRKIIAQIEALRHTLPSICNRFLLGIAQRTSPLTRLNYCYDLKMFFTFLKDEVEEFTKVPFLNFTAKHLEMITPFHIELYLNYLSNYTAKNGTIHTNGEHAKMRKLSCLRAFFKYYFKIEEISRNIMPNIDMPKIHGKPIIRLEHDETRRMLSAVTHGEHLTDKQFAFHAHTALRDKTIITFFLTTGVRVSELVGLNFGDIDLKRNSFRVTRKGGNTEMLFFPPALHAQLQEYLDVYNGDVDEPLFKSLQKKRINQRTVQNLVKKYAQGAVPLKKISPHKLRSTFGTNLYRETKDIYIVADVLGHRDVNTTTKHYAAISDDIRRVAAEKVTLPTE